MDNLQLYRKRIIPDECLLLKDDVIVEETEDYIATKWQTLNPKPAFSHGASIYMLKDGIKVSKMYRQDNSLLYWYCDIVEYSFDKEKNTLTSTDLLADVIIYPDNRVKVMDLDELSEAISKDLISKEQACTCLNNLNNLLTIIDRDKFDRYQAIFSRLGL